MKKAMTKPPVVPPEDVVFEEGAKAVVPAPPADVVQSSGKDDLETLTHLGEIVEPFFRKSTNIMGFPSYSTFDALFHPFFGQFVHLEQPVILTSISKTLSKISLCTLPTDLARNSIEHFYGAIIAETGIYKELGLDTKSSIPIESLLKYFPEFEALHKLNGSYIQLVNNPYLVILSMPLEYRAFFTHATDILVNKKIPWDSKGERTAFGKYLDLRDILACANERKELPKERQYFEFYNNIPGEKITK